MIREEYKFINAIKYTKLDCKKCSISEDYQYLLYKRYKFKIESDVISFDCIKFSLNNHVFTAKKQNNNWIVENKNGDNDE